MLVEIIVITKQSIHSPVLDVVAMLYRRSYYSAQIANTDPNNGQVIHILAFHISYVFCRI